MNDLRARGCLYRKHPALVPKAVNDRVVAGLLAHPPTGRAFPFHVKEQWHHATGVRGSQLREQLPVLTGFPPPLPCLREETGLGTAHDRTETYMSPDA